METEEADSLRATLDERMAVHRADLEDLVSIPSVSAPGFDPAMVRESAGAVRDLLARRGFEDARLIGVDGAHPAVYGSWSGAGPRAPTVLCYAHHDVQPPGDAAAWTSPPFEPAERHGRVYGRGAADDKAGILAHVAALDTWLRAAGGPPVNVKVIVEGEEETGSAHLDAFLARYAGELRADVVVATDTMNWRVGVPAVTYLLRGLVDAEVEVSATTHALHSGMYGGPVPDPVSGLARLLATLTDATGNVAIPGFADDARPPTAEEQRRLEALDFDEGRFREDAGLLDGVSLTGDPGVSVLERLWMRPALTVVGLDAPPVDGSSNTIQPSARARVSVRLAPGQDPVRARERLCDRLAGAAPWGLRTSVTPGAAAGAWVADPGDDRHRPAFAAASRALRSAFGTPPVLVGLGGTIPFVQPISSTLGAPALLLGVEDPDSRAHGIDESLHLEDWHRVCLGHALLLGELAGP